MIRPIGLALLAAAANSAWAQYVVSARAGTVNFTNGQVSIDAKPVERKSNKITTLKDGQLLHTDNGRAEVLLGPGIFVRLGPHAALRMVDSRLTDTQVRLEEGTALVEVIDIPNGSNLHMLVGDSRTAFRGIGLHRFNADSGDLSVYGGHADVSVGAQTFDAARGRVIHLLNTPIETRFDPRDKDPLLQWAAARSFRLYISNPAARERLTHWEPSNGTYYFNRDFGVQFISRVATRSPLALPFPPPNPSGDLGPRPDPTPKPSSSTQQYPTVTYPGPASVGGFPLN
jgi:hypothetical protein